MENNELVAIRRRRLQQVIDEMFGGSQIKMVEKIEINAGELSSLLKKKSFGEKKARSLEKLLDLPYKYLDDESENMQRLGRDRLAILGDDLNAQVEWLIQNADDEIVTMFGIMVRAVYQKKADELTRKKHRNV